MLLTRSKVFLTLTKARLSFSVVFSTIAGYLLATDNVDFFDILLLLFGGYCMILEGFTDNDEEELLDTVFGDDFDDKDGLEVPDFLK